MIDILGKGRRTLRSKRIIATILPIFSCVLLNLQVRNLSFFDLSIIEPLPSPHDWSMQCCSVGSAVVVASPTCVPRPLCLPSLPFCSVRSMCAMLGCIPGEFGLPRTPAPSSLDGDPLQWASSSSTHMISSASRACSSVSSTFPHASLVSHPVACADPHTSHRAYARV